MVERKKVPSTVIRRLPKYYRHLSELLKENTSRISSNELSQRMGITASQVRQDFNFFGGFGQQGYGYNVQHLFDEIGSILGVNSRKKMIIVGAGNLGRALANYSNFKDRGFELVGIFDVNKELIGQVINGIEISDFQNINSFLAENNVDIGILSVPYDETPYAAQKLVDCGIRALWNFSPIDIRLPHDVIIENVHLSDSLMVLSYQLDQNFSDGWQVDNRE